MRDTNSRDGGDRKAAEDFLRTIRLHPKDSRPYNGMVPARPHARYRQGA